MSKLAARIKAVYPQHALDIAKKAGEAVAATARANAPINSTGRPCLVGVLPLPLEPSRAAVRLRSDRIPDSRWEWGALGVPRSPFHNHLRLDGLTTEDRQTDPRLAVRGNDAWLGVTHYEPQDHASCRCAWIEDLQDQFITDAIATWPAEVAAAS